jgi:hypothetical protein
VTTQELLDRLEAIDKGMGLDGVDRGHPLRQALQEAIKRIAKEIEP